MDSGALAMRDPILVTGCARSGTSFVTGALEICGMQVGCICGATKENPKGQVENHQAIGNCVKPFLKRLGKDPRGQSPLADPEEVPRDPGVARCIEEVVDAQGVDRSKPWGLKLAKAGPIWPALAEGWPEAKWVIVRRKRRDIAESCREARFMRAYSTHEEWVEWARYHEFCFEQIEDHCDSFEIWPEKALQGDLFELHLLIEWLNLEWREDSVRGWADPSLYRGGHG